MCVFVVLGVVVFCVSVVFVILLLLFVGFCGCSFSSNGLVSTWEQVWRRGISFGGGGGSGSFIQQVAFCPDDLA